MVFLNPFLCRTISAECYFILQYNCLDRVERVYFILIYYLGCNLLVQDVTNIDNRNISYFKVEFVNLLYIINLYSP